MAFAGISRRPDGDGKPVLAVIQMPRSFCSRLKQQASAGVPPELKDAWTQYMVNEFRHNERMSEGALQAFMKAYRLTVWVYATLFAVSIGFFVVAAAIGLGKPDSIVAIAFAVLGVTMLLALFVRHPVRALEQNLHHMARCCIQHILDAPYEHAGPEDGAD
jgi:hypothetical protein